MTELRAEWMYRLLDYEHYRIFLGDLELGLVVINHADQSVSVVELDDAAVLDLMEIPVSYRACRTWLRAHEAPISGDATA